MTAESENKKPSDTFTMVIDGEARDIFMSFGLLNELTGVVGDPLRCAQLYLDPDLRTVVVGACLHERDKRGKIIKEVKAITDVEVNIEEVELLLGWVADHMLSFFSRSLKTILAMGPQLSEMEALVETGDLKPSMVGSNASRSKKVSAGPTTAAPAN